MIVFQGWFQSRVGEPTRLPLPFDRACTARVRPCRTGKAARFRRESSTGPAESRNVIDVLTRFNLCALTGQVWNWSRNFDRGHCRWKNLDLKRYVRLTGAPFRIGDPLAGRLSRRLRNRQGQGLLQHRFHGY
jgi:hypothetical protein